MRKAKRFMRDILIGSALGIVSAVIFMAAVLAYCRMAGPLM